MPTFTQIVRNYRTTFKGETRGFKHRLYRSKALNHRPQLKGQCIRVYTTKPKKPNSSQRKITKVRLSTKRKALVCIPGRGHNLQAYSVVLIRGGRPRDIPGVHYYAMRGKYSFTGKEVFSRTGGRSKHGIKHPRNQKSY